jgi:phenylacetate-CoA ligase
LRGFLEGSFHIDQSKTLAVVGLALGSWIGGEHLSWALKSLALTVAYPFTVFSPGSNHAEIIDILCAANRFADQFLLFLCPGAIAHLHLKAQHAGRPLPVDKIRYVVLGEPFPESMRLGLMKDLRPSATKPVMLSVYGSADTGLLGAESPASVAIRQLLAQNADLAHELEIDPPLPHFFHLAAEDAYLESVRGEMCVTRWQGIPLVRYNLHDRVRFFSWKRLCQAVLNSPTLRAEETAVARSLDVTPLANVLAIAGRSDGCLLLCGTNLTETMLDGAVHAPALENLLTGAYRARVLFEGERQYLEFDLELSPRGPLAAEQTDRIYQELIQALGREQPEFLDDWKNVYRTWDHDPALRILRLRFVPFPELSERSEQQIKTRGIGS